MQVHARRTSRVTLALAIAATVSACVHGANGSAAGSAAGEGGSPRSTRYDFVVEVANHSWSDVIVYVMEGPQPRRLGHVTASQNARFKVPATIVRPTGTIQLMARPIAGAPLLMPRVIVSPGQRVLVSLENNRSLSSIVVR